MYFELLLDLQSFSGQWTFQTNQEGDVTMVDVKSDVEDLVYVVCYHTG